MELQALGNRSLAILYGNFNFILEQSNRNYQLYIDKFSFNTIRQEYRTEKNNYFESLDTAQNKISAQIISIPLSLGASIFTFYQFKSSKVVLVMIYINIDLLRIYCRSNSIEYF